MIKKNSNNNQTTEATTTDSIHDEFADVLYQKIGNKWYAFSFVKEEVYFSEITDEQLEAIRSDLDQNPAGGSDVGSAA